MCMKYGATTRLTYLVLLGVLAFNANAEGLSEYLQNSEATKMATETLTSAVKTIIPSAETPLELETKNSTQLKNIIELVVAGIVAAALIIVVLVTFLGRWLTGREKKLIKKLRIEAEENTSHITSAITTIREHEKETKQISQYMRSQADELSTQQAVTEKFSKGVADVSKQIKIHEKEINAASTQIKEDIIKVKEYWSAQVGETVDTINLFQRNLSGNINVASEGLEQITQQKTISEALLKKVLNNHDEQSLTIKDNNEISNKISSNLTQAYEESNQLLSLLRRQQEQAELSLKEYSERLNNFEEQAYEKFDMSFQVADLARQELSANLDENRKHIATMRRQEEQSHGINTQISKNLESLDYSKIVKISETLDNTQNMFDEIHHKVEVTRVMLEELKQAGDANKIDSLDNPFENTREDTTVAITDYKRASDDSSTSLSFFKDIPKKKSNKT